jgi:predicted metalloprotease
MYWENNRESDQIEDRRNAPGGGLGGGRRRVGGRGIGLGTIAIALVAGWIFGINPMTIPRDGVQNSRRARRGFCGMRREARILG